jgi:GAF domain-containing protein
MAVTRHGDGCSADATAHVLRTETSRDLVALDDVDAMLAALCQRVRRLLSSDVAYITLFDRDTGESYIRMTDGIASAEFHGLRLAEGSGLGGLVAQAGVAKSTEDYFTDTRFRHTDDVDNRVRIEGLRGLLAVPLRHDGEVMGVVLAGVRTIRQFEPTEVALLELLASHTAIAMKKARLLDESRRACAELVAANASLREDRERLESTLSFHDRLTNLVLEGADVDDVLRAMEHVLGGRLELRVNSGHRRDGGPVGPAGTISVPVTAGSRNLGTLVLSDVADPEGRRHLVSRGALTVASVLMNLRTRAETGSRLRGDLADELFGVQPVPADVLRQRARLLGVDLDAPHVVVVTQVVLSPNPSSAVAQVASRADRIAAERGGFAGTVDGQNVAVLPSSDAEAVALAWRRLVAGREGTATTVGASGPAQGVPALIEAHSEARRTVNVLLAMGCQGTAATSADLGVFGVVFAHSTAGQLEDLVQRVLTPVLAYDRAHNAELLATLQAWLEHGGHLAKSASALHVHINTLYQRLDRVDQVLGTQWRDPDRRLDLHLAVRLREIAGRLKQQMQASASTR